MNWTLLLLLYLIKVKTALSIDLICIYLIASIAPLAIEVIHRKVYLSIIIISSLTSATNILMIRHIIDIEICCVCILPLLIGMPFTQGLRLLPLSLRRWHGKRAVHSHLVLCTRITRIENATIVMLRFYLWGRGRGPSEIVFFVFSDLFVLIIIRIKMLWCLFLYILIDVIIFNIFEIWIYVSAIILRCGGRRWHVLFDLIVDEFNINLLIMTVPFLWRYLLLVAFTLASINIGVVLAMESNMRLLATLMLAISVFIAWTSILIMMLRVKMLFTSLTIFVALVGLFLSTSVVLVPAAMVVSVPFLLLAIFVVVVNRSVLATRMVESWPPIDVLRLFIMGLVMLVVRRRMSVVVVVLLIVITIVACLTVIFLIFEIVWAFIWGVMGVTVLLVGTMMVGLSTSGGIIFWTVLLLTRVGLIVFHNKKFNSITNLYGIRTI